MGEEKNITAVIFWLQGLVSHLLLVYLDLQELPRKTREPGEQFGRSTLSNVPSAGAVLPTVC